MVEEPKFWLEVTNRGDLGRDLHAPQSNEKGGEFWGYSLIREISPGDIVLHYHKPRQAIVAWSLAVSTFREGEVIWAARGTSARSSRVIPHPRPGWILDLAEFSEFRGSVTLEHIRDRSTDITRLRDQLTEVSTAAPRFPFAISAKRPIRPAQGYLFKVPRDFFVLFPQLSAAIESTPVTNRGELSAKGRPRTTSSSRKQRNTRTEDQETVSLGTAYQPAHDGISLGFIDVFARDPAELERSLRAHARTQNLFAAYLEGIGCEPRSPRPYEPNFDVAWYWDGRRCVGEVKSITYQNEEKQLRLGLGQVLRYADLLRVEGEQPVQPVLVVEREPRDLSWVQLCRSLGVLLVWPECFGRLSEQL